MSPHVIILGAGPSGIVTAHKLLKYTTSKVPGLKITLVSPSTHFFYNPAVVRGLVPGEFDDDVLFYPIAPGFERYTSDQFELLIGTAVGFDPAANTAKVQLGGKDDGEKIVDLSYDHLVIATGASVPNGMPFKSLSSYGETLKAYKKLQDDVAGAHSIVVAGAGPTGVEIAAELGQKYGAEKEITLIAQRERVLDGLLTSVQKSAEGNLAKLGVRIMHSAKVSRYEEGVVYLDNGETLSADLYLPSFGVRPNTSFIPERYLDEKKNLVLDLTLQVEGLANVWAAGDVGNLESKQMARVEPQVIHLSANLDAALTGHEDLVKEYSIRESPFIFVTQGRHTGVGQIGYIKMFGWIVGMAKGRDMFASRAPGLVAGKNIVIRYM
jgi:NADH dehydrogenase FAD-containing subunit